MTARTIAERRPARVIARDPAGRAPSALVVVPLWLIAARVYPRLCVARERLDARCHALFLRAFVLPTALEARPDLAARRRLQPTRFGARCHRD
jgi:hypothetical protein